MKKDRFELIATGILIGWIATAAGTVTSLLGMPVIPADAPTVLVETVVVHQQHAQAEAPTRDVYAMLVNGR
jgi:hypothetical protein